MTLLDHFNACDYKPGPWHKIGDNTEYRIDKIDGVNYLSFQGSNENRDWWYNLTPWIEPYRGCGWKCHAGYAHVWRKCNDDIFDLLDPKIPLIIRGYSHGADLAILAHEDAKYRKYKVLDSVTFGASAILSGKFGDIFDNLLRVYVRGDFVTTVWAWFKHVGKSHPIGPKALPWWTHHRQVEYRKELA
jgi:hypothetical protein